MTGPWNQSQSSLVASEAWTGSPFDLCVRETLVRVRLDFDQYLVGDELNFCLADMPDRPFPFVHIISCDLSLGCKYHFEDFDD